MRTPQNVQTIWTPGYVGTDRYPATVPTAYNVPPPTTADRPLMAGRDGDRAAIRRLLTGARR